MSTATMASVDRSTAPAKLAATPALCVMNLGPMGIAMSPGRQVMNAAAASKPAMPHRRKVPEWLHVWLF